MVNGVVKRCEAQPRLSIATFGRFELAVGADKYSLAVFTSATSRCRRNSKQQDKIR
jgi:hypothetical protein